MYPNEHKLRQRVKAAIQTKHTHIRVYHTEIVDCYTSGGVLHGVFFPSEKVIF